VKNDIKIFYKSAYRLDDSGHGGERRSWQIHSEYSKKVEIIHINVQNNSFPNFFKRLWVGLLFLIRNSLPLRSFNHVSTIGFKVYNLNCLFRTYPDTKNLLWEPDSNYSDFYIPFVCEKHEIKVAVFPHNMESLVANRKSCLSGKKSPHWFNEEVNLFRKCNAVFTISTEEQWLLQLFNISSTYYPYYPSLKIESQFLKIREARKFIPNKVGILMVGTAHNPPTKAGMAEVIDFYLSNQLNFILIIAGYGTEVLLEKYQNLPDSIRVIGSLSQKKMDEYLTQCKAVLIHQKGGTGALTKIQEYIIGGITILANLTSLRSYHNLKGIYSYHDLDILRNIDQLDYEIPDLPTFDSFLQKINVFNIKIG